MFVDFGFTLYSFDLWGAHNPAPPKKITEGGLFLVMPDLSLTCFLLNSLNLNDRVYLWPQGFYLSLFWYTFSFLLTPFLAG